MGIHMSFSYVLAKNLLLSFEDDCILTSNSSSKLSFTNFSQPGTKFYVLIFFFFLVTSSKSTPKKLSKPLAKTTKQKTTSTTKLKSNLELAGIERNKKLGILHGPNTRNMKLEFLSKILTLGHRHMFIWFSDKDMSNMYEKGWFPPYMNLGMCIKEYNHNSHSSQKRKKHMFKSKMCVNVKVSHVTYKKCFNF